MVGRVQLMPLNKCANPGHSAISITSTNASYHQWQAELRVEQHARRLATAGSATGERLLTSPSFTEQSTPMRRPYHWGRK